MKKYTIPLKVLIAYHLETDTYVRFTAPGNPKTYTVQLDAELSVKDKMIIARCAEGQGAPLFPSQQVYYPGKKLKQVWAHWKNSGGKAFYEWFNK